MIIDQLIDNYKPTQADFTITLPKGEALKFRAITSYEDMQALKEGAAKFIKLCRSDKCPGDWRGNIPESDIALVTVFLLNKTALEPALPQGSLLKLCKQAGLLFSNIADQWNAQQSYSQLKAEVDELEELKND